MSEQIKRSKLLHFLNTTPAEETATFSLIGEGVPSMPVNKNPETDDQQFIHQDSPRTILKSYSSELAITQLATKGDNVYEFVDELAFRDAVLDEAKTEVVEVRAYNTDKGPYPAKKWPAVVVINSYGDDAADPLQIDYTVNSTGDPEFGTFDIDTKEFKPETSAQTATKSLAKGDVK